MQERRANRFRRANRVALPAHVLSTVVAYRAPVNLAPEPVGRRPPSDEAVARACERHVLDVLPEGTYAHPASGLAKREAALVRKQVPQACRYSAS